MKKLLIACLATVGVILGSFLLSIDWIVEAAIAGGASQALGVETRVGFARLRPLAGDLRVSRVRIANPPGFDEPYFLAVHRAEVEANLQDLGNEVVEIPLIHLEGVDVALERDGNRTNYGAILANMGSFEDEEESAPAADSGPAQRFVVRRLLIRNVTARVEWSQVASNETKLDLQIPEIEVRNLGEESGGLTTADLSDLIVRVILGAIARNGSALPEAVISGLDPGLRGIGYVSGVVVFDVGGALLDTTTTGFDAAREAARRAIGGLFEAEDEE